MGAHLNNWLKKEGFSKRRKFNTLQNKLWELLISYNKSKLFTGT
jgi:hypothetical protein